ncbi:MAG TPA: hypothetical protein VGJ00_06695 [Rhabdochlamydiaceae bacterium]
MGSERTSSQWTQIAMQNHTAGATKGSLAEPYCIRPADEEMIFRSEVRLKKASGKLAAGLVSDMSMVNPMLT